MEINNDVFAALEHPVVKTETKYKKECLHGSHLRARLVITI
jgi:hypothetical protein